MSALLAMIRRVRTLWAALVRRLGGDVTPAPSLTTAAMPALAAAPTVAAETVAAERPSPPVATETVVAATSASLSLVVAPTVEPVADDPHEHVRGDMSVSAAVSAAMSAVVAAPAAEPVLARGDALRADGGPALSVRQFFARVSAAVPSGLAVDFMDWQTVRVERYFLAVGASGRAPPRGPALAEEVVLKRAFADFEWD